MNSDYTKRYIVVNLEFEAMHCWPACPIPEVAFLRHPHRHLFKIKATKEVRHNDRDVEVIMFKEEVAVALYERFPERDLGSWSCEQLAEWLLEKFDCKEVQVLEDGENGAIVCKTK